MEMTTSRIVRKVDKIDITFNGSTYCAFDGLKRIGCFTNEEAAVSFAIDKKDSKGDEL